MPNPLSVVQVDPSLYTGPYDAALTEGLRANDVQVRWAARRARADETDLPREGLESVFGGLSGGAKAGGAVAKLRTGLGYLAGWRELLSRLDTLRPDVLHLQWALLPMADAAIIGKARRRVPVVITVHDLQPYNGAPTSRLQVLGLQRALRVANHLIVHTTAARETLLARGFDHHRVSVIPHGPLRLRTAPASARDAGSRPDPRWTVVLFGKLQAYKGADVLIEAVAAMDPAARQRCRFILAGEPLTPIGPLRARVAELGLDDRFEFRMHRHSEEEMAGLFEDADAFVFPYRQIEASGVFALVRSYRKWVVASDLGAFREALADGSQGTLVPPGDPLALARALEAAIGRTPAEGAAAGPDWPEIGRLTREVYKRLATEHAGRARR